MQLNDVIMILSLQIAAILRLLLRVQKLGLQDGLPGKASYIANCKLLLVSYTVTSFHLFNVDYPPI